MSFESELEDARWRNRRTGNPEHWSSGQTMWPGMQGQGEPCKSCDLLHAEVATLRSQLMSPLWRAERRKARVLELQKQRRERVRGNQERWARVTLGLFLGVPVFVIAMSVLWRLAIETVLK